MKTVGEMLRWRARLNPEGIVLVHEGRETTYRELDRRSNQIANALLAAGLRPQERVCVLDKGHDEFLEVLFGIAKAGGVYTPVNWRLAAPEVAFVVNDAESPIVFVGDTFADVLSSVATDLPRVRTVVCWGPGRTSWQTFGAFRGSGSEDDPRRDAAPTDTAWQLYTSGTTGHPKGAELTHANVCETAALGAVGFGPIHPGDVALICMPLYHIGGSGYALAAFYAGARLVVADVREDRTGTGMQDCGG